MHIIKYCYFDVRTLVYIDIPFINPVEMYRKYDLKANLDTKLKINNSPPTKIEQIHKTIPITNLDECSLCSLANLLLTLITRLQNNNIFI